MLYRPRDRSNYRHGRNEGAEKKGKQERIKLLIFFRRSLPGLILHIIFIYNGHNTIGGGTV